MVEVNGEKEYSIRIQWLKQQGAYVQDNQFNDLIQHRFDRGYTLILPQRASKGPEYNLV